MKKWLIVNVMMLLSSTGAVTLVGNEVQIALDSAGNAIAAWVDFANMDVCVAYFSGTTQTWSSATVLGSSAYPPVLAVSSSGDAAMVWINSTSVPGSVVVQATYYTLLTNSWSAVQNISLAQSSIGVSAGALNLSITNDLNNTAIAIWKESDPSTPLSVVHSSFATRTGGGIWSPNVILSD